MANYGDLRVSRVLSEDNDFVVLEVGKRDDVVFHLQQSEETGETVGGDKFMTIIFVRQVDGKIETWDPFKE
jgi:hypothetical protein